MQALFGGRAVVHPLSPATTALIFGDYHEACYTDGANDGRVGDVDDAIPYLLGNTSPTITECERACAAYVDTFDFEDMASQYEPEECIPEIAWSEWCKGYTSGLAHALFDVMFSRRTCEVCGGFDEGNTCCP